AAQRAAVGSVRDAGYLEHVLDDARREREGDRDRGAVDGALLVEPRRGAGELLLGPGAEALEPAHPLLGERPAQVVDRLDAELGAQLADRLRPQALGAEQRHDASRVLLPERLQLRDLPGLEELPDLA